MQTNKSEWQVAEVQVSYKPTHDRTVTIGGSQDAQRVLREMWDPNMLPIQEQFCVLFLNKANEVLGFRCLHTGGTQSTMVDVKLLMSLCCKMLASGIIIAHNHPCGVTLVSQSDRKMTWKIKEVCRLMEIDLIDHIIITSDSYVSFADKGLI